MKLGIHIAQILFVSADVAVSVEQVDEGITTILAGVRILFDVLLTDREVSIRNLGIKLIYLIYHLELHILTKLVGYEYDFNSS